MNATPVTLNAHDAISAKKLADTLDVTPKTVLRWIRIGRRGRKLAAKQVGREWWTTWAAVNAFGESNVSEDAEPSAAMSASALARHEACMETLRTEFGLKV